MSIKQLRNSFLILIIFTISLFAAQVDPLIKLHGQKCVSLVFDDNYSAAHKEADILIKKFPKSPSGYFMKAAVYHYEMNYIGEKKFSSQFYSVCDQSVSLGKEIPAGPAGEWDRFFMAGTLGIRGAYERSRNRLVTSLKLGWRAIDVFRPLNIKGNIDALYGVAVYDFWVGANIKVLWWMDDAKDERPRALSDLERVTTEGIFTKDVVLYDLLEMYTNEKDYNSVKRVANSILKKHPTNSFALEFLFESLIELGDYPNAKKALFRRETALRAKSAPSSRFAELNKDWKVLEKKGLSR